MVATTWLECDPLGRHSPLSVRVDWEPGFRKLPQVRATKSTARGMQKTSLIPKNREHSSVLFLQNAAKQKQHVGGSLRLDRSAADIPEGQLLSDA